MKRKLERKGSGESGSFDSISIDDENSDDQESNFFNSKVNFRY